MGEMFEGDWKNFAFRIARQQHYPGICNFIRQNKWKEDPLDKYFDDMPPTPFEPLSFSFESLGRNLSLMAFDKTSGKIAGVQINGLNNRDFILMKSQKDKPFPAWSKKGVAKEQLKRRVYYDEWFVRHQFPEIDHYIEFNTVVVGEEYRGQGLATEMWNRGIKMGRAMNCPMIMTWSSNPAIHWIGKKTGFEELNKVKVNEWKDFDTGELVAPNARDDEVVMSMVMKLN